MSCSAWIDDFAVDDTASDVDTDGDTDGDTDSDGDSDGDGDVDTGEPSLCGEKVVAPSGNTLEFCAVRSGTPTLGCLEGKSGESSCIADETPAHRVTMRSYIIGRYEVTGAQFARFVAERPEWARDGAMAVDKCNSSYLLNWINDNPPSSLAQTPVTSICWYAARAFCQWLGIGFDLPTEAQWEYAARGQFDGQDGRPYRRYPFGNTPNCDLGNFENCEAAVMPVGSTEGVSPFGLYDMGGNAWEWVRDWYRDDHYCDPAELGYFTRPDCDLDFSWQNPTGPSSGTTKVLRGGSWYHPAEMMRTAKRHGVSPNSSSNLSGFRCAR